MPPTWVNAPVTQSAVEGQAVTFNCMVRGVPAPTVKWTVRSGNWGENIMFVSGA